MDGEKWPIFGCKVGQTDLIVVKLLLNVWRCLPHVQIKFQIDTSKHAQKSPENFSLAQNPFKPPKCVYKTWGLNIIFEAMNAEKWHWPIFGYKIGQCPDWYETRTRSMVPPTKCICQVSNRYLKNVEKSPENFKKS